MHEQAHDAARRAIRRPDAVQLVSEYFDVGADPVFTGAWFERLSGGGDREEVGDRFTASDLVAVTMLSVSATARAAVEILETRRDHLDGLLSEIPVVDIGSEDGQRILRDGDSAAYRLWTELKGLDGIGWVTAGKLLARKRPALVPVYDRLVGSYLGWPRPSAWAFYADLFTDNDVVSRLAGVRDSAATGGVSLLRVLDVLLWRTAQGHGVSLDEQEAPMSHGRLP